MSKKDTVRMWCSHCQTYHYPTQDTVTHYLFKNQKPWRCKQAAHAARAKKQSMPLGTRRKHKINDKTVIMVKTKEGWKPEHRIVMEKHLGRKLSPQERITHINGDHTDNDINNLKLHSGPKSSAKKENVNEKTFKCIKILAESQPNLPPSEIADMFSLKMQTVEKILISPSIEAMNNSEEKPTKETESQRKLIDYVTAETKQKISNLAEKYNMPPTDIHVLFPNLALSTIKHIIKTHGNGDARPAQARQ